MDVVSRPEIQGYRELNDWELRMINSIKTRAAEIGDLVNVLRSSNATSQRTPSGYKVDQRWVAIGATELQQGFMALTRAIAQPESF